MKSRSWLEIVYNPPFKEQLFSCCCHSNLFTYNIHAIFYLWNLEKRLGSIMFSFRHLSLIGFPHFPHKNNNDTLIYNTSASTNCYTVLSVAEDKLPVQVNAAKNDRCATTRREVEPTMKQWCNNKSLALVKGGERLD